LKAGLLAHKTMASAKADLLAKIDGHDRLTRQIFDALKPDASEEVIRSISRCLRRELAGFQAQVDALDAPDAVPRPLGSDPVSDPASAERGANGKVWAIHGRDGVVAISASAEGASRIMAETLVYEDAMGFSPTPLGITAIDLEHNYETADGEGPLTSLGPS